MGRGKHCSAEGRKLIKKLHQEGQSQRKIAEIIGCSKKMVENAIKYEEKQETRGRKTKISETLKRKILRHVKRDPFVTSSALKKQYQLDIDTSTIRLMLLKNDLRARSARKVPFLSKRNIKQRLQFAKEHINWPVSKWRNILWSDETKVNLFNSDRSSLQVRRPKNKEFCPQYTIKTVKHGGGNIMVWGCFSYYGVGPLYRIRDIMDAKFYTNILREVMMPYAEWEMPLEWIFQQDNDPKHSSKLAKAWFRDNHVQVLGWPSQSPDLNPIENLWGEVKRCLRGKNPSNKDELWTMVETAWKNIPVTTCQKLVDSMPKRCFAVIKNNGSSTKY